MKKFLAIFLTFVLCFGVLSVALAAEDDAVATVPDGYIGIYTAEDLDNVRNNLSGKYILMNNIDLSSYENWSPIGTSETPFTGELDGNGYVLKNLIFNDKFSNAKDIDSGLFGYAKGAILSDVLIKNLSVKFDQSDSTEVYCTFGAVAGVARNSTIRSCAVSGKIDAENIAQLNISGIIGLPLYSKFENCANYADINVKLNNTALLLRIGGVAAFLRYTPLTESCNYGNITINGADVKLNKNFYIGGVYGDAADNFQNMTHDGDNYNRGTVSVDFSTSRTFIGGIAGQSYSVVNSYNAGKIIYPEDFAGFAGAVTGNAFECSLAINMPQRLTNVYYLNESMKDFSYGEHSYVDEEDDIFENIKYLTPEEMKKQESFVGFDFENVWAMEENGYPILRNMPVIPETEKPGVTKPTTTTELTTDESTTTPATEESTTIPVATPTEPSTEESTTTPVATPIEPSTTEPSTSEIITTETPTEPVTNPATEPSTTQPVTETESTTEPVTESPATPIEPSTEPTSEPDDNRCWVLKWLIKIFKAIIDWFVKLFVMLGF